MLVLGVVLLAGGVVLAATKLCLRCGGRSPAGSTVCQGCGKEFPF